jgi:RNA recognition motif-containing protein
MKIYVGNLDYNIDETELKAVFETYGIVESVKLVIDKFTGRPKGFGFIEMSSVSDGNKAIGELDGSYMNDRQINVKKALPPKQY